MATASHKIGLTTATIICMNAMIGAGIFSTPAKLALSVGPAGIITYLFVIIAVLFMALSLARVAQAYPQAGSFYTYTKQWGGHIMGLAAAGAYAVGVIIALGLLSQLAASYIHTYIPSISIQTIGLALITLIVTLNVIGVRIVQIGQIILLTCTLFALGATTLLCLSQANVQNLHPFMPHGWSSLASATSTAIFAFFGFESAASLYTIMQNPQRDIPRALTASIVIVGLIYLLFISSIILAIPASLFTSEQMPLSQTIAAAFPQYAWIGSLIGIAILTALIGVLQSMTYSVAQLVHAFLSHVHIKAAQSLIKSSYGLQWIIIFVGLCTLFNFSMISSMGVFFNLTAIFIVFAFSCSIVTLAVKHHDKTMGQRITTAIGLLTACFIFLSACNGLVQELGKL